MGIAIRDWNPGDCLVSRRANGEAKELSNLATEAERSKIQPNSGDCYKSLQQNSPGPLMDDSTVNFHDVFFFIFCYNLAKNEEKHVMEIYG